MLVQAQVVALGKRGDRQSSPSGTNPSRASPIGRRIGGYDYKTESFQRPRAEQHAHSREMRNSNFLVPPPLGVGVFGKLPAARKRKDCQRIGSADPRGSACPRNESRLEMWLGRSTCAMLVQAQVVPWWGTGRRAEFSPSGFHPVTGIAYRQEDRRVRLQNGGDLATACGQPHALPGNEVFEISPGAGLDLLG